MKLRFLSAFALGTLLLSAQPSGEDMAQRRVDMLAKRLSLTAAQKQQALTIFTGASSSDATLRQSLRTAHDALSTAIKANDTAAIDQAAGQVGTLTGQLTAADAKANAAFYQILTPDQQSQFNVGPMMGAGPGGPRGGGPGTNNMRRPRQ